ncbi:hypothetical protein ALP8811_00331 [Aliiroseovarius pelagivivens]|uniref:Uncharacterized protein n=1 Tax=Aliiroseovarius pelagivivens TaxID=1639690 RepID=A0A2R8AHL1_9RHOB|nr:hypothetical protein ALP8811_00331 [Aliiroseovarius pelagivivens]
MAIITVMSGVVTQTVVILTKVDVIMTANNMNYAEMAGESGRYLAAP